MHVVKAHDERRAEFLDTAMQLFMERGYEATTINTIIDTVGVSKGAFYHYFRTKEDLLDEIAERTSQAALTLVEPLVDDDSLDAVAKLNELFHRTNAFKAANREIIIAIAEVFYSDRNILLRDRLSRRSREMVVPLLTRIIEQGNREGLMQVTHPTETATLVLRVGSELVSEIAESLVAADQNDQAASAVIRMMDVYTESVERMLGVAPGRLKLVDDAMIRVIQGDRT